MNYNCCVLLDKLASTNELLNNLTNFSGILSETSTHQTILNGAVKKIYSCYRAVVVDTSDLQCTDCICRQKLYSLLEELEDKLKNKCFN